MFLPILVKIIEFLRDIYRSQEFGSILAVLGLCLWKIGPGELKIYYWN